MNKILRKLLIVLALPLAAHAGNNVVLEGFENGFTTNGEGQTNLAVFNEYGVRPGGDVAISVYTATDPGDPRVTQGTNSMKVVFPVDGFGNDMTFALSDAAATLLENAASSNQLARYILRYDIVFENYNLLSYYNQHFLIANDWEYARSAGAVVSTYTNGITYGLTSFSVPVELPGIGIPTNPPSTHNAGDFAAAGIPGVTALILDQFAGVTEPLTNFTIYIDNVRIVDTYATPTTVPVVTTLQSFEGPTNSTLADIGNIGGGVTVSVYTTNDQYDAAADGGVPNVDTPGYPFPLSDVSDFSVTDGTNSLAVTVGNPYYSYGIFTLSFPTNSLLAQLTAAHPVAYSLTNYTLRFDVTTPLVSVPQGASDGDYINIDYNGQYAAAFPMSTGRRQSDGQTGLQRETYSLTLDQIAYWPNSTINFSYSEPASGWTAAPFYFDNFVLINTAPPPPSITGESYNPTTSQFTLTWQSSPGQTYSVKFASTLQSGFTDTLRSGIASGGTSTAATVTTPGGSAGFLIVTSP